MPPGASVGSSWDEVNHVRPAWPKRHSVPRAGLVPLRRASRRSGARKRLVLEQSFTPWARFLQGEEITCTGDGREGQLPRYCCQMQHGARTPGSFGAHYWTRLCPGCPGWERLGMLTRGWGFGELLCIWLCIFDVGLGTSDAPLAQFL